jgi:F-type H+-transporting ATPase subunit a
MTIIALLVPYAAPLPFMFLEIFVGSIQAFIFGMLTLVFINMAITEHGEVAESHA